MNLTNEQLRDLKITGTASASGGTFRRVFIQGEGEIDGNVECANLKVQGVMNIRGSLTSTQIKIMGTSEIEGNCTGEYVKFTGDILIKGDCTAESFRASGGFTIEGLLNAGQVDVRLYGPAKVTEIGGDTIRVKLPFRIFSGYKILTADVIEGDEIQLEQTHAKVVRGKKVYIGPGCEIDLVEYTQEFRQARKTQVKEANKV